MIIAEYENIEYGIKATVRQTGAAKFAVQLVDTEAGELMPVVRTFPDLDAALAYAKELTA